MFIILSQAELMLFRMKDLLFRTDSFQEVCSKSSSGAIIPLSKSTLDVCDSKM